MNHTLDYTFAAHCAPTLAGIKIANLVSLSHAKHIHIAEALHSYNTALSEKGVHFLNIFSSHKHNLVLVYRKDALQKRLNEPEIKDLLLEFGYTNSNINTMLLHLSKRFVSHNDFPHEVGIFLGYPLDDVKGFISCKGKDYLLSGYWKVYTNLEPARKLFGQYTHCRNDLLLRLHDGVSISHLCAS